MDKKILAFINGFVNAVRHGDLLISRESSPNGSQIVRVKVITEDSEILMYEFWHNSKKESKDNSSPKHTGGKKPYIMVMVEEIEKLRMKEEVKNVEELIGFLVCLGQYIQWNTGKLIHKRSKKLIQYKDLQNIFGYGNKKLNRILSELKKHDLLFGTQEGYFISSRFIKKGGR